MTGLRRSISENRKRKKNHSAVPNSDSPEITGTGEAFEEESDSTMIQHRIWWRRMVIPNFEEMKVRMKRILRKQNAAYGCVRKYKRSAVSDGRRYE